MARHVTHPADVVSQQDEPVGSNLKARTSRLTVANMPVPMTR
jgi:hypothetical protein